MQRKKLKELKRIYDELYRKAIALKNQYNPCDWQNGHCWRERRYWIRPNPAERWEKYESDSCCNDPACRFLTNAGCRVKCLACALWYCPKLRPFLPPDMAKQLDTLIRVSFSMGLITSHRESKSEVFKRIQSYAEQEEEKFKNEVEDTKRQFGI